MTDRRTTVFVDELTSVLPRLRRFAIGLTGSRADGEDLAQATVERAYGQRHRFEMGTRLDAWLFRIARNLFLNQIRAHKVRERHLQSVEATMDQVADGERIAHGNIAFTRMAEALERLPEEQRSLLLLVAVEGLSYKEAAAVADLPLGTVASRIARARGTLSALLGEDAPRNMANRTGSETGKRQG